MENEEDAPDQSDRIEAKLDALLAEVAKVRECQQAQDRTLNTILIRANAIYRRGQTRRDKE